jgi:hypothetical protein
VVLKEGSSDPEVIKCQESLIEWFLIINIIALFNQ